MRLPDSYRLWLSIHQPDTPGKAPLDALSNAAASVSPLAVHLHIPAGQQADAAIASVLAQTFPCWTLYITSGDGSLAILPDDPRICPLSIPFETRGAALNHVLSITGAPYLVPLSADCTLTPGALTAYARAARADGTALFYADQDERDSRGERCNPWLKPEWDEDLFLAQDYLSAACAIPVEPARRAGVDRACPDAFAVASLLARLLLGPEALPAIHVPFLATTTPLGTWCAAVPERAALLRALAGMEAAPAPFGTFSIRYPLPHPAPGVSIIIPTRDRVDLLSVCVEGVLNHTDYPDIELIIADNGSVKPETLAFFAQCAHDPRVRIVHWPHPYNYSAINNFAVSHAGKPYICLLNNDTEVVDPDWLRALMAHAVRPGTGATGARLLYPDGSIQHAGVVVGMGGAAGHAHRGLLEGEPGYFAQALVTRSTTAVTAACLVVAKERFDAVGGLDEDGLAIAYNDIDLCLKLREKGWRNIYEPRAVLIHHESKSRGQDFAPEHLERYKRELAVFQERWRTVGFRDPMHHPALDPASEEYRLKI